jgi:hypothetical protein
MAQHALLSASASYRWLNCPGSVDLEKGFKNTTSTFAQEGSLAHELGELSLRCQLGEITKRSYDSKVNKLIKDNSLFTADMPDYVEIYTNTCVEKFAESKSKSSDAIALVEQKLDFSEWVPDGFGTGDFVIIADGTMEICDLKYGKGIPVSAIANSQMRLYALGAIAEFGFVYDIEKVKMTIIQPRLDSISTDEMTVEDLLKWAEEIVKPIAQLAIKGEGEIKAGDHCKFCKAKAVCRAQADKNMEIAKYEFADSKILSEEEIADILSKVDELTKWATEIKDYALDAAVNSGVIFPGYKIVEGRSNRKYTDETKVAEILLKEGFQETIIYTKKLEGISKMETALGKKEVIRLLGDYIEKPQGRPCLVPESDKRPVFNSAENDFGAISND